jgi:hypothetical protein
MLRLATAMRNCSTRFHRRFNQSFWCAVYNVACFVMMVVSVILSGIVFVVWQTAQRLTGRVASVTKRTQRSDVLDLRNDGSGERSTVA